MDESMNVENETQPRHKPPVSRGRTACEILAGVVTGFAVALPVACVISNPAAHRGFFDSLAPLTSFVVFSIVYGLASTVGVYLVGNRGKQTGSFLSTLGWGCLGGLVMPLTSPLAWFPSRVLVVGVEKIVAWSLWALVLLIPPIAAAYGFNLGISGTFTWFPHWKDRGKVTDESTIVENEKHAHQKPPLSVGRIAGEILAVTAVGCVVAVLATYVLLAGSGGDCMGFGRLAAALFVFPTVYGLASTVGVYLVSNRGKQTGSFLLTLGCGLGGGLVMFVLLPLVLFHTSAFDAFRRPLPASGPIETIYLIVQSVVLLGSVLLIPPITATLGFNLTRRYKEPPSS
jgi:hypothetical protein